MLYLLTALFIGQVNEMIITYFAGIFTSFQAISSNHWQPQSSYPPHDPQRRFSPEKNYDHNQNKM